MKFPEIYRWNPKLDKYHTQIGDPFGCFLISANKAHGRHLNVVACDGIETDWEHVSVSLCDWPTKCPSWDEMCLVKSLFWDDEECVVQFHPSKTDYVNNHPGCLHLWKCVKTPFPTPPSICV